MFVSISCVKQEADDNRVRITFKIEDTCFSQEQMVVGPSRVYMGSNDLIPIAILMLYARRNLNVVRNLVKYYIWQHKGHILRVNADAEFIMSHYPQLGYHHQIKLVRHYCSEFIASQTNKHAGSLPRASHYAQLSYPIQWLNPGLFF